MYWLKRISTGFLRDADASAGEATSTPAPAPEAAPANSRQITESVDGAGEPARLIRAQKGVEKEAKPGVKPPRENFAKETPAQATPAQGIDALSFEQIEKLLADPTAEAASSDDDDLGFDTDEPEGKPEGRFNKTVQHLRKRAQAAEQRFSTLEMELQKRDQMLALMQKDLTHQRESWQTELEHMRKPERSNEPPPLNPNDPDYEIKKFKQTLMGEFENTLSTREKALVQQIEELKNVHQQREQREESARTRMRYNQFADRAASELTTGFEQERGGRLNKALGQVILAAAYGWKTDPSTAARVLDRVMTDYGLGKLKLRASSTKAAPAVPPPAPMGRSAANPRGTAIPSRDDARSSGHRDELEAMVARDGIIRT